MTRIAQTLVVFLCLPWKNPNGLKAPDFRAKKVGSSFLHTRQWRSSRLHHRWSNQYVAISAAARNMKDDIMHRDYRENGSSNSCSATAEINDSLSHWLSSPKRYARALNMTIEDMDKTKEKRQQAVNKLQEELSLTTTSPMERHRLVCRHRYRYGKHPFICHNCWSYLPICVCPSDDEKENMRIKLACRRVILWTHHEEWGSPSNTGSVLPLCLENVQLWMKGYHDSEMEELLKDDSILPVLLWPQPPTTQDGGNSSSSKNDLATLSTPSSPSLCSQQYPQYISTSTQLQELKAASITDNIVKKEIVLIAMEGTWRQARRMVSKFPQYIPRLSVTASSIGDRDDKQDNVDDDKGSEHRSILYPLRKQTRHETQVSDNMCTAEAVVAALQLLDCLSHEESQQVLNMARLKVDRTRRYQGKRLRA